MVMHFTVSIKVRDAFGMHLGATHNKAVRYNCKCLGSSSLILVNQNP